MDDMSESAKANATYAPTACIDESELMEGPKLGSEPKCEDPAREATSAGQSFATNAAVLGSKSTARKLKSQCQSLLRSRLALGTVMTTARFWQRSAKARCFPKNL